MTAERFKRLYRKIINKEKNKKPIRMFCPNGYQPLYPIIEKIYVGLKEKKEEKLEKKKKIN